MDYFPATHPWTTTPTGTTVTFRVFSIYDKVPLNFSPTFPIFQLQVERSGQVVFPSVTMVYWD